MKVLIDANVILDVLLNRSPWVTDSQAVWDANHRQQIHGQVVATTITNLFYIARKLIGQPLALSGVRDCLAENSFAGVRPWLVRWLSGLRFVWDRLRPTENEPAIAVVVD